MAELFANFEVNRESKVRVLSQLSAASLVAHALILWTIIYVPAFRDALNIAGLIANTRFVDKPYNKTEIGEDVRLVQLSSEKFHYPEGYFALENQVNTSGTAAGSQGDPYAPKIISRAEREQQPSPEASPT